MSVKGSTGAITVVDLASVNAIGFGAVNVNNVILAPVTLGWTVIADGTTEDYDCRLFLPSYSGAGNLLTVRNTGNTGNTRVQLPRPRRRWRAARPQRCCASPHHLEGGVPPRSIVSA